MNACRLVSLALALVLWVVPSASAQTSTAGVAGVVTDASRAVLPGATVTATNNATGRRYVAVTDERGEYRLINVEPAPTGSRRSCGFATTELTAYRAAGRPERQHPVRAEGRRAPRERHGQRRGAARRHAVVAGRRQRRSAADGELPLQGRNWMELSMLVKGITANDVSTVAGRRARRAVPAQSRRPAGDAEARPGALRPAEVQPRSDRRVPDRHATVRHHAGAVDRHSGAGDHEGRAPTT